MTDVEEIRVTNTRELSQFCGILLRHFAEAEAEAEPAAIAEIGALTEAVEQLALAGKESAMAWLGIGAEMVRPTCALFKASAGMRGEIFLPNLDFADATGQKLLAVTLSLVLRKAELDGYFVIAEAWIAAARVDEADPLPPSQRPDRREVVIVSAANRDQHVIRCYPITRDAAGVATLGDAEADAGRGFEIATPLFTDLFGLTDPETPLPQLH